MLAIVDGKFTSLVHVLEFFYLSLSFLIFMTVAFLVDRRVSNRNGLNLFRSRRCENANAFDEQDRMARLS